MIIAIDGPAASGKSTVARGVAKALGFKYVDTGGMYRAVTLKALDREMDIGREMELGRQEALGDMADATDLDCAAPLRDGDEPRVIMDGVDVTAEIRSPRISGAVSVVSAVPAVRRSMLEKQRRLARDADVVMEGRDIGSVVFPEADLKVFLDASREVRVHRRVAELKERGFEVCRADVEKDIERRDRIDSTRAAAPLVKPADAVALETTGLTIEQSVSEVAGLARARLGIK